MQTRFNPSLVALSIFVAIFASYVALNLSYSVTQAHKGRAQNLWLAAGALALGIGIWSMHFLGMLAFEMPGMQMAYDIPLMALSVLVAIGGSGLALYVVSRDQVPAGSLISGGISMAGAIAGMHYIGMASMRMAAVIHWNIFLVVASILIALVASFSALFILSHLRNKMERPWQLLAASILMGIAIAGMHYTGMFAASFTHTHETGIDPSDVLVSSELVSGVITTTLIILSLALFGSINQRLLLRGTQKSGEILENSEEKFRRLVEAVKDYAIFMLDPSGRMTTWNLGAERISGYSEKEVLGKPVSIFYTQADLDNNTAEKELVAASTTDHFEGEGLRVRKDGSTYWASVVITSLHDQNGKLTGFSKVTRDITAVKEAAQRMKRLNEELEERVQIRTQELERREKQLRTITNAAPIFLAQLDLTGRILFANESFSKWFLRDKESIVGQTFEEILGPERYLLNQPFLEKAMKTGEITTYERLSVSGNLNAILGVTFVPEFDADHKIIGIIVVASDITRHKEIEAELKKAKEAAEVANATKSAFLANMSHEIRTPLGAILGFSELLSTAEMTPQERANSVEVVKRNGRLLSNIINDILDLSKVEAGKIEVERIQVPFNEVLKEMSSLLKLEASEKGIELKIKAEGNIPEQIETDPLRLRQVLLNIVGNAIKFTRLGSVEVTVKLLPPVSGITKLAFIVKDTGEGIAPEKVGRLFTPFTQADVSTTRKFGGTGLGLVLSKRLANVLGGDVVLTESVRGIGSIFTVTIDPGLPEKALTAGMTASAAPAVKTPSTPKQVDPHPRDDRKANLKELKILVVDDSSDNQALIKRILKIAGAVVETANNGQEGVEKALTNNYSFVLMDLQMPIMDGYEATKILREKGYIKPIIALTAHAMKEERERSLRSGFDEHITKPIDQQLLVKTLAEYRS